MKYIEDNKKWWNNVVDEHLNSDFYDNDTFIQGRNSLNEIERHHLKDIAGKSVLHIQCHFGQDTISLKRLGAASVLGTDISDQAIFRARELALTCGEACEFICTNTWDIDSNVPGQYDLVFMSYGVLTWLDDLDRLAKIVQGKLNTGGSVLIAEFHPALMMYEFSDFSIAYPYFNLGMMSEEREGSYASDESHKKVHHFWNHPIAEILMSFRNNGFELDVFEEYDFSPYACFENMEEVEKGRYVFGNKAFRLPHVFVLKAKRI